MFIDTHCHLDDEKISNIDTVSAYLKNGVDRVINMGCDVNSSIKSKILADENESVYFGAGIHPENTDCSYKDLDVIFSLASHEKCVCIGEIGLDYHYEGFDKNKQTELFVKQIDIANEVKLPICVHSRDSQADTFNIIKNNIKKLSFGGVMHCFSGSVETAKEYIKLGFYISFGGTLTFKNANKIVEVAKNIPLDKILTETDSPYLAPHPLRGNVNQPSNIRFVVEALASIYGISVEEMAKITSNNAKRLYFKLK